MTCTPCCFLLFAAALAAPAAEPVPLFDGKTLAGWASLDGGKPGDGWEVANGTIHRKAKGGDLYLGASLATSTSASSSRCP
ncbi:MAG: hypothetical protein U1F77_16585 [Kiritimatiellia bacterium]